MRHLILFIFLFSISQMLSATVLRKIEISGNKKTTNEAIIQHGQIFIDRELTEEGVQTIKENLGRVNQIHLKNIEFKDGVLKIEVQDKWTLFPVPMFTESGNYHNRGFLIYEDNFLGSLGTLAPGISWSNSIFNAILYYQDESLFSPTTGVKVLLMRKSDYSEFIRNDITQNIHESRYNLLTITPNYLYKNQVFKAGPIYIDKSIYNQDSNKIFSDRSKGIFFRHHLNAYQALDVMYEGLVTTYDLYSLKSQKEWIFRHEADARWSHSLGSHFLNLGIHGHHVNDQSYLFPKYLGGEEGYRGYDKSSLAAQRNIGAYTQYQFHLVKQIFLSPFYEFNSSKLISPVLGGKRLDDHTVGIGLRYYFKKISIPAVIFDYGKNLNDKSNHFHINVGVNL